jgi:hypothetical protein
VIITNVNTNVIEKTLNQHKIHIYRLGLLSLIGGKLDRLVNSTQHDGDGETIWKETESSWRGSGIDLNACAENHHNVHGKLTSMTMLL